MAEDQDIEGSDLSALIAGEIRSARRYADEELSDKRARNIEYYNGEMADTPAPPNRSAVVSNDVRDTMSWMLPGIIRVFTASDNMALYEPTTEKDREGAKQATDYINYLFFKDSPGYRNLYNATFDSLLGGNGIIYHYWDPTPKTETTHHTRLTPPDLAMLMEEEGVEILAQEQNQEPDTIQMPDETGQLVEMQVPTFNVKVQRTTARGRVCIHTCKPENFYLDAEATTIDEARFAAYLHDHKTRSDLVEMGFDRDVVDGLAADTLSMSDEEGLARQRQIVTFRTERLKSQELIDLYECYIKADVDGDGIAEMVQVWYAGDAGGGTVLDWSVWEDELPFSDIPCYPVPHRWDAESAADRTTDVQKIKTVLLRGVLDQTYAAAQPMREVVQGSVLNPDILIAPKFGGVIWKKDNASPIVNYQPPFVGDKLYTALEYMDMVIAKRTGVSRTTMALDPEALQNQTATASQDQRDAGYSQIELVARNMAELGWTRVFQCLLKLVVKHQDRPRIIRLRDKFLQMDPRVWNANMDVTVNVGLGTGSRDRDLAMLQTVKQDQFVLATQFAERGAMDKAIDMIPRILLTMKKSAESAGLKDPDAYYPDFGEPEVETMKKAAAEAAQKPDPKIQLEQEKAKADIAIQQQKSQQSVQQSQQDFQLKQMQLQAEMQLKREQLVAELQLKREQMMAELALQRELGHANAAAKVEASRTSGVHVGGEPG